MTIDTQGMSTSKGGVIDPNAVYPPYIPKKINVFTDREREELKEIFREVLNESTR